MAESTLSLKRDDIRKRIAMYLSFGLDEDEWDTGQIEVLDLILADGLRCFEAPSTEKEPYEWSFRKIQTEITTANTTQVYDAPDDFAGIVDWMLIKKTGGGEAISIIPVDVLLQKQATEAPANGAPQCAAVRKKSTAPSTTVSVEWEILFFPIPDGNFEVNFSYPAVPDVPTATSNTYTSVPPVHSQTVVAACLAAAERYTQPESQTQQQYWQERLAASIQHDRQVARALEESFAFTNPAYGTYYWFARRIGRWSQYGWNYNEWTNAQTEEVDDILQRGLRRFYFPPSIPRGEGIPPASPHRWSFLAPTGDITMLTGVVEYELQDGFQGILGEPSFVADSTYKSLSQITDSERRALQAKDDTAGTPRYYSISPKTTTGSANQRQKISLYPKPVDAHNSTLLTYRFTKTPSILVVASPFPYGGEAHAETMLAACRCVWAEGGEQEQNAYQAYLQRLGASIEVDKPLEADTVMPWNTTAPTFGSYDWLLEEMGAEMGLGGNPGVWTHEEERRIDSFVRRGYEIFRQPHLTGDPSLQHHRWSFLYTTNTLSTVASHSTGTVTVTITTGVCEFTSNTLPTWAAEGHLDLDGVWYEVESRTDADTLVLVDRGVAFAAGQEYTLHRIWYDLPSTVEEIDGPLTYAPGSAPYETVAERTEAFIRARRQYQPSTGYARYFATDPNTDETAGTTWKLTAWPNWDGVYVLTYRYKIKPPVMTTGDFPLGGTEHAETVLASCMAVLDSRKHRENFMLKLAGSIRLDQRQHAPRSLGVGYDPSDGMGSGWPNHGRDNHATTYLGQ